MKKIIKNSTSDVIIIDNVTNFHEVLVYDVKGYFVGIIIKEDPGLYKDYCYCVRNSISKSHKFKTRKELMLFLIKQGCKLYVADQIIEDRDI